MEFITLCNEIDLPIELIEALCAVDTGLTDGEALAYAERLTDASGYAAAAADLKERFSDDGYGLSMLRVMLSAALRTHARYENAGIPHAVFIDTMKCFSRFSREHRDSFGAYGFDRGFWVGRQLSCSLFRLGSLEFERAVYEGKPALSVHIPSDADLAPARIADSFAQARAFFARYYPDYADCVVYCYSWLLSPALIGLLPAESKIVRFLRLFRIVKWDENAEGYKQWVYKDKNLAPKDFPEHTSLQRSMKQYVLSGGLIGEACGIYEEKTPQFCGGSQLD